jgi:coniferyl-aldehyde dehydrogenase
MEWLERLLSMLQGNRMRIASAVAADFGSRSAHETQLAEVFTVCSSIRFAQRNLRRWMRPERRSVQASARPGRASVLYQPRGVVGIISPWNYPFQLAVAPLVPALSAGNRVMIKPSERTPRTSELLRELLDEALGASVCAVVQGGREISAAFTRLRFDHILFTGSVSVGRQVMQAAAENLTPVTLELGGKCPALVHPTYSISRAMKRVAVGKWLNAGQTCVAPDYLLVPKESVEEAARELAACTAKLYPTLRSNPDYTGLVDEAQRRRLEHLIEDAEARGARAVRLQPAGEQLGRDSGKLAPTLLLDVRENMAVMQEEVFGPVLPIIGYERVEDAIRYINAGERPLALYYFDQNRRRVRDVLEQTVTGGATINDTLVHCAIDDLPFGGVGASGMGAYHSMEGFRTFSHAKAVFHQSRLNGTSLLYPPFTTFTDRLLDLLIGR